MDSLLKPKYAYALSALLTMVLAAGCDKNVAWTDTVSVPEEGWTSDRPVIFNLDPKAYEPEENRFERMTSQAVGDTVPRLRGQYCAMISLRYKDDCNASRISLAMETASLDREITNDTLTFTLFGDDGRSLGTGRFGLNETTLTLPTPLEITDGTVVTFTPLSYSTPVTSLLSVTLTLRSSP